MELVGRITRTQRTGDGRLQAEFCCTSDEVFYFFMPPVCHPDEDELVRCWIHRVRKKGSLKEDRVLGRWEKFDV